MGFGATATTVDDTASHTPSMCSKMLMYYVYMLYKCSVSSFFFLLKLFFVVPKK